MAIRAPYLPYDKLRQIAAQFLAEHHAEGTIPIPIEHIVEYKFGLDIVPTPGLHNNFDIDSYPTSDLTEIRIDEFVYNNRESRYRFSLAHEISHLVIHRDIFSELTFSTIEEWKEAVQSIPPDQYSWIETQAYGLAGLILVPEDHLKVVFSSVIETAAKAGIDLHAASDVARQTAEGHIGTQFKVSRNAIRKRLDADSLWRN